MHSGDWRTMGLKKCPTCGGKIIEATRMCLNCGLTAPGETQRDLTVRDRLSKYVPTPIRSVYPAFIIVGFFTTLVFVAVAIASFFRTSPDPPSPEYWHTTVKRQDFENGWPFSVDVVELRCYGIHSGIQTVFCDGVEYALSEKAKSEGYRDVSEVCPPGKHGLWTFQMLAAGICRPLTDELGLHSEKILYAEDFGDQWPLIVDSVEVRCYWKARITTMVVGKVEYGLNQKAFDNNYPRFDDIWKFDLHGASQKMDISPIFNEAKDLCPNY
jgi:hypothetical protein